MDKAMYLRRAADIKLVTKGMAVDLAKSLVINGFGEKELVAQGQLSVSETEGTWIVKGQRLREKVTRDDLRYLRGDLILEVSKFDCQILQYDIPAVMPLFPEHVPDSWPPEGR